MVPGMIMLWHGALEDIPSGWTLCDGRMGTPNLKYKFVLGAGSAHPPGETGGQLSHNHDFTGDGHLHEISGGVVVGGGAVFDDFTDSVPAVGTTDPSNGYADLPPYYALCYIMKL